MSRSTIQRPFVPMVCFPGRPLFEDFCSRLWILQDIFCDDDFVLESVSDLSLDGMGVFSG